MTEGSPSGSFASPSSLANAAASARNPKFPPPLAMLLGKNSPAPSIGSPFSTARTGDEHAGGPASLSTELPSPAPTRTSVHSGTNMYDTSINSPAPAPFGSATMYPPPTHYRPEDDRSSTYGPRGREGELDSQARPQPPASTRRDFHTDASRDYINDRHQGPGPGPDHHVRRESYEPPSFYADPNRGRDPRADTSVYGRPARSPEPRDRVPDRRSFLDSRRDPRDDRDRDMRDPRDVRDRPREYRRDESPRRAGHGQSSPPRSQAVLSTCKLTTMLPVFLSPQATAIVIVEVPDRPLRLLARSSPNRQRCTFTLPDDQPSTKPLPIHQASTSERPPRPLPSLMLPGRTTGTRPPRLRHRTRPPVSRCPGTLLTLQPARLTTPMDLPTSGRGTPSLLTRLLLGRRTTRRPTAEVDPLPRTETRATARRSGTRENDPTTGLLLLLVHLAWAATVGPRTSRISSEGDCSTLLPARRLLRRRRRLTGTTADGREQIRRRLVREEGRCSIGSSQSERAVRCLM